MASLKHLPVEVMEHIFDNINEVNDLQQCVLVNKHFYKVLNPKLWRSPSRSNLGEWTVHTPVSALLKYLKIAQDHHTIPLGYHIRALKITTYDSSQDTLSLLALTPLVEDLSLFSVDLGKEGLKRVASLYPKLKILKLGYLDLTDSSMDILAHQCPNLHTLSFVDLPKLTFKTILALKALPLERINISQCPGLLTANSAALIATFDRLTSLRLFEGKNGLSSDFMKQFVPSTPNHPAPLPNLTEFVSEENSLDLDEHLLVSFIDSHPLLETLVLYATKFLLYGIFAIIRSLPRLKKLVMRKRIGHFPRPLRRLIATCKHLEYLELYYRPRFSESRFPEISKKAIESGRLELDDIERIRQNPDWISDEYVGGRGGEGR